MAKEEEGYSYIGSSSLPELMELFKEKDKEGWQVFSVFTEKGVYKAAIKKVGGGYIYGWNRRESLSRLDQLIKEAGDGCQVIGKVKSIYDNTDFPYEAIFKILR
ncbi:MAG: hypothetical protein Q7R84_01140 [bacterium]|nr:hypothetical protein [bacterium]